MSGPLIPFKKGDTVTVTYEGVQFLLQGLQFVQYGLGKLNIKGGPRDVRGAGVFAGGGGFNVTISEWQLDGPIER